MSRIFFAGGLRGWLQTVPAPGVAAAGPSPTPHRSTRLGAQPRPLRYPQRHANKPASERPRPETSHLPPNRPRRQLRLVAHHAERPHCEQANRADLAVQIWHLVALGRDPHSWPRARPHLRAAAGRPAGRWVTFAQAAAVAASFDREKAAHAMLPKTCCMHHAAYHGCQVRRGQDTVAGGQRERHDNAGHACGRAGRGVARALLRVDRRRGARLPCKRGALRWGRTRLPTHGLIRLEAGGTGSGKLVLLEEEKPELHPKKGTPGLLQLRAGSSGATHRF